MSISRTLLKIFRSVSGIPAKFHIKFSRNIIVGENLIIKGSPIIDVYPGCKLTIGNNVVLNSSNIGYHVNMFAPVKIFADKKNAKITIGDNTRIHGSAIHACELIEIGKNCLIAANCQIMDSNGHDLSFECVENRINTKGVSNPIIIGDNVWLGCGCIILPGVTIGSGCVVAANSVVVKDLPAMTLAGGNPAKVIKFF